LVKYIIMRRTDKLLVNDYSKLRSRMQKTMASCNSNAAWNVETMASYISNVAWLNVVKGSYCTEQINIIY